MKILTNHLGYERFGSKQAVLQSDTSVQLTHIELIASETGKVITTLPILASGPVDQWGNSQFYSIDFSHLNDCGQYFLRANECDSHPFEIKDAVLMSACFSDLLHYFKGQRCSGIFDQHDKTAKVFGSDKTVDVSGGWYDASGDLSKYFSHLSVANYMNPQQIPMVVWNMFSGASLLANHPDFKKHSQVRLQDEAIFGADFLMRMFDDAGYFYMTVFDKWSKDPTQRDLCAYSTQAGIKTADYQAAFRQGAGIAIAALCRASLSPTGGAFSAVEYRQTAETAYWHLIDNNHKYCDDGVENIIDEYCALIAAVDLFKTTQDERYLQQARNWAVKLSARQCSDKNQTHFWSANSDGSRPYSHAAEAGYPVIALSQYLSIETDQDCYDNALNVVTNALNFELSISSEVYNPFGYPRQYVKGVDEDKRSAFFIAHNNESGYWWQGENARLGSLAAMVYLASPYLHDEALKNKLANFAQSCLNWIVGLNPFDMCMFDGLGFNNPDYLPELGFFNAKGGICNGITAGFDNENDIAFIPTEQADDMMQNWRWGEQWIPHGGWFLLAIIGQYSQLSIR